MRLIAQTLIDGLVLGGIYALSAVGFSLIFGVLHVINLSHGILVLIGAYLALILSQTLRIDPLLTMPLVMAVMFILGYAYQRLLIQHAVDRSQLGSMLLTFGVALMLQNVMIWAFSPDMRNITPSYAFVSFHVGGLSFDAVQNKRSACQPFVACLPDNAAEVLVAGARDPRHGAADACRAPVRGECAARLRADLRGISRFRGRGRHRDRHHPAVLARR